MSLDFKLRRASMGLSMHASLWLPVWMSPLDPKDMAELFETPASARGCLFRGDRALGVRSPQGPVDRALEFFTRFYLQDDILTKVDRAAMMCFAGDAGGVPRQ